MVKITVEIPDEMVFMKEKISSMEWSFIATKILQEKLREVVRYNEIISKSKATEKDIEELSAEIKDAVWKNSKHTK